MRDPFGAIVFVTALLVGSATVCHAAGPESAGTVVELETPLASPHPLQGYLRKPGGSGALPAVVLLGSCVGNWRRLDERWGKLIASWGYVTLTVDSLGPRGLQSTCTGAPSDDFAFDAYRALKFLAQRSFVDPARVAALGFSSLGGWIVLSSVERGTIERNSQDKFRAAVAFYPPCLGFKGDMTVPTLIMIGELDDWTTATACRNMVDGKDDWGISRQKGNGVPVRLIVYPGAYHGFDAPNLKTPSDMFGHHLEFNQAAADRSIAALREFLDWTIGARSQGQALAK